MVGYNQALGLPQGSVRAILALGIVGSSVYALVKGVIGFEQFLAMNSAVLAFYFGTKNKDDRIEKLSQKLDDCNEE